MNEPEQVSNDILQDKIEKTEESNVESIIVSVTEEQKQTTSAPRATVLDTQRLLKTESKQNSQLSELQNRYTDLKKELILSVKNNWVLEQDIEKTGNRIRLLIRNHLKTEELKSLLDTFEKIQLRLNAVPSDAHILSEEQVNVTFMLGYVTY
jgi:hypothetical protein